MKNKFLPCYECKKVFNLSVTGVCPFCGKLNGDRSKIRLTGSYFEIQGHRELIKKTKKLLEKESSTRLTIVSKINKLEKLTDIKSNGTGFVKITANGQSISVSEAAFRINIQSDINALVKELVEAALALEEFNSKFKQRK